MGAKVVSLFSGGGGFDLGFVAEGYEVIWAIDNNKDAANTYRKNIGSQIVCEDVNKIPIESIPQADVVIGGPPCQSFSLAGNRNTEDERGRLIWKYIQIIEHVQPQAFVFENVQGLLSAKNSSGEKIIGLLKSAFRKIGYTVGQQVLNAADYGVPQRRKRVIIVGLRDQFVPFVFPKPTHGDREKKLKPYVSVEEALGDLPAAIDDENGWVECIEPPRNEYQRLMRRSSKITEHFRQKMSELDEYIVKHVKPGGNYMDIPTDVRSARIRRLQEEGGHTTCYGRLAPDKPSYTINTYFNRPNVGCNIHYKGNRLITVREALRLQSFPDDYEIVSSSKKGKNLIVGNAVPPILAGIIANVLKPYIEGT